MTLGNKRGFRVAARGAVSGLIAVFAVAAFAGAGPANEELLSPERNKLIAGLDTLDLGVKPAVKRSDALVLISLSAGWIDVLAETPNTAKAKLLAETLDRGFDNLPGTEFDYAAEGVWGVADGTRDGSRWFQRRSSQTIEIGRVVAGLRAAGFSPQVVVRVRRYLEPTVGLFRRDRTSGWGYWNVTSAQPGDEVTVSAEITGWMLVGLVFYLTGFLIIAAAGFAAAHIFAKRRSIPIERRRLIYQRLLVGGMVAGMAVHFPIFIWFSTAGHLKRITDLWTGSPSSIGLAFPAILVLPLLIPVAMKASKPVEKELYGEPEPEVKAALEAVRKEETRVSRITLLILLAPAAGLAVYLFALAISWGEPRLIAAVAAVFLVALLLMPFVQKRLRKRPAQSALNQATERVRSLVEPIAEKLGVRIRNVSVDYQGEMVVLVNAFVSVGGHLKVTGGALDKLTDEELDSVLAHECAHLKLGHLRNRLLMTVLPMAILFAVMVAAPRFLPPSSGQFRFVFLAVPLLVAVTLMPVMRRMFAQHELDADALALETTRHPDAMESAWLKMVQNSGMPGIHDVDGLTSHPAMSKRVAAMREHARSLGLSA